MASTLLKKRIDKTRDSIKMGDFARCLELSLLWPIVIFILLNNQIIVGAFFQNSAEENGLVEKLTQRLTKLTPPAGMLNNSVTVFCDLYQIVDVDEKNGVIKLKIWLFISYKMEEKLWDPSEHGNMTNIQLKGDTLWRPDISKIHIS